MIILEIIVRQPFTLPCRSETPVPTRFARFLSIVLLHAHALVGREGPLIIPPLESSLACNAFPRLAGD